MVNKIIVVTIVSGFQCELRVEFLGRNQRTLTRVRRVSDFLLLREDVDVEHQEIEEPSRLFITCTTITAALENLEGERCAVIRIGIVIFHF